MKDTSGNNKLHLLRQHFETYAYVWFLVLFWLYYVLMILDSSYVREVVFSYDSSSYFRAAEAMRQGYGLHDDALAGGGGFFSWWPAGYPALIAAFASVFRGLSVFLCSKILSAVVIGLFLFFLGRAFGRISPVLALLLLNNGIVEFYRISLSEAVFTPLLFLFVYVLAGIITEKDPRIRSYVLLYLSMTGVFLMRYFGIVAGLFAGCVWLVLLVFYLRHREEKPLRNKVLLLGVSGLAAALTEGAYLLMNIRMTDYATGLPRAEFNDKIWELKAQLYDALQQELLNIFSVRESPLFDSFTIKAQRILVFAILAGLVFLLIKRKKADRPAVFILAGLFYDVMFIAVRFRSSMDSFNSRFFAPATLLILTGVILIAAEKIRGRWTKAAVAAVGFLLLLGIFSISYGWIRDGIEPTAYAEMQHDILQEYRDVAPRSVILEHEQSYRAPFRYFRADVVFDGHIEAADTADTVLARYEMYDHIYISKPSIRRLLYAEDRSISDDMRAYLRSLLEQGESSGKYLLFASPAP